MPGTQFIPEAAPTITINPQQVGSERPILVYEVTLETRSGVWDETFGTRETLAAFLQGCQAIAAMLGYHDLKIPEMPREHI